MMFRFLFVCVLMLFSMDVYAKASDFFHFFKIDMSEEYPDINKFAEDLNKKNSSFDRGYDFRSLIGNKFKKKFGRTIKSYGSSESRIKPHYEDDLIDLLNALPKDQYQYVGPMLHEVPGMSEKILNMPGIKETKNKFPEDIAERYKDKKDLEYISPFLYFALMPQIWDEPKVENLDKPQVIKARRNNKKVRLPNCLLEKIGLEPKEKTPDKVKKINVPMNKIAQDIRTPSPTATSPLTKADVGAFVGTLDDIISWGNYNNKAILLQLIRAEALFAIWEYEQNSGLKQDMLKDAVNPCQRLVQKIKFADLYTEFYSVISKHGYNPEEWAYTCDKTIKACRVSDSNLATANAIDAYNKGYYDKYVDMLPKKWSDEIYTAYAAIIKMHASNQNDIEAVKSYKEELETKLMKNEYLILSAPIF